MTLASILDEESLLEQANGAGSRADKIAKLIDFGVSPLRAHELAHGGPDLEPADPTAGCQVSGTDVMGGA